MVVDLKTDRQNTRIAELARSFNLAEIYVFGSRAEEIASNVKGKAVSRAQAVSDVDIGVRPLHNVSMTAKDRVRLAVALEDLLDVDRVDLVFLPEADPFLALHIIRGELLYSDDDDNQSRYELYVLRRAGDLVPLKKERIEMILGVKGR